MSMRSLFLSHGSPMNALADNGYTRFLRTFGTRLDVDAIVIVSAHWESRALTVTRTDDIYETIYDFFGFPQELYEVVYPARGSATIADKVAACLNDASIPCSMDERRGMDHGSWTLLLHLLPVADIPVVQMSLNASLTTREQIEIGKALKGLEGENIALIGSGVTVHNLRSLDWQKGFDDPTERWATEFDDWLLENSSLTHAEPLENYLNIAPHAHRAAPTLEHFVPYLIARGAGRAEKPALLHRAYELGNLSYLGVEF